MKMSEREDVGKRIQVGWEEIADAVTWAVLSSQDDRSQPYRRLANDDIGRCDKVPKSWITTKLENMWEDV